MALLRTLVCADSLRAVQVLSCSALHRGVVFCILRGVASTSSAKFQQVAADEQRDTAAVVAAAAASAEPAWLQDAAAVWQQIAGLIPHQAQQLLHEQPHLRTFLRTGFSSSSFAHNLHLLRCLGIGQLPVPAELRACLALVPHQALEQVLTGPSMQRLLHQQQQQPQVHVTAVMQQLTSHLQMLMAHAKKRQQQQQEQKQLMELLNVHITQQQAHSEQRTHKQRGTKQSTGSTRQQQQQKDQQRDEQQQKQQRRTSSEEHLQQVAQAVVDALQLNPAQRLQAAAEGGQPAHSSSSSSTGARRRTLSSSSRRRSSSSNDDPPGLPAEQLAAALARAARNVALRGKPAPQPQQAAAFASSVAAAAQMAAHDVLALLLQRPMLLWSQDSTAAGEGPGDMLLHLHSQLPDLSMPLLLQRTPALLAAPKAHVESVLTLLLNRLALSKQHAAEVLDKHPKLLIAGAGPASLNLGYLVGLGLRQPELQQMLLKNAEWLMRPLQELTTQWQFLSTVAKASLPDIVLLPELLSLPIRSQLGPRILYARKRQVKLLLPSHEAMLPKLPTQQWLQHKLVPLELWLTASEQRMCAAVGLSLEDYTRFKAAWARVDAFSRPPSGTTAGSDS